VDIRETHIPPAKLLTAFSILKKEKTSRLSGRLFISNRHRYPLGQNLGLYDAMDVRETHITPAKLLTAFSILKKEKTSRLSGRLFISNRH
jgi:hypothetical protein